MPLYELIVMAKCGPAKSTANLARNVSTSIIQAGGNVREVKILGDRIITKPRMCKDTKSYIVGRFLQILFDGNLNCKDQAIDKAQKSYETMKIDVFRVENFYRRTQEYAKETGPASESMVHRSSQKKSDLVDKIVRVKGTEPL